MILQRHKIFINVKSLLKALEYVKLKDALLNDTFSQSLLIVVSLDIRVFQNKFINETRIKLHRA